MPLPNQEKKIKEKKQMKDTLIQKIVAEKMAQHSEGNQSSCTGCGACANCIHCTGGGGHCR